MPETRNPNKTDEKERASRKVNFSTDANTGENVIFGVLLEADKPNINGFTFPKDVLKKAVEEYNNKNHKVITYDNGSIEVVNKQKIVAEVDKLDFDGKKVTVQAKVLDNKQKALFPVEGKVFNTISFAQLSDNDYTVKEQEINFIDIIDDVDTVEEM